MPPEWEDDFWHENSATSPFEAKSKEKSGGRTLRPPLYNAEDYTAALRQHFSLHGAHLPASVLLDHTRAGKDDQPEMTMKRFLNGSELLFKLEADLRNAYPTFVQEFVSGHSEGVASLLETLKVIQAALDDVTGIREQRKLISDEQKCLQCVKLCLRNIEAVSKLASYPGGLYPLASAMISTVTGTRIIALEILTVVCSEGGPDGHYKVSEAISTLRLRLGEPIRCKLIIGAISSAAPGTFQAKGIRFLTSWVASAPSPKHKVHIQCELEEAGFNMASLKKAAELGGAREAREVQAELEEWERVAIDVDTLTRQNCQLRNSVATLQQELATLKDKLKRMDMPSQKEESGKKKGPTRSRGKTRSEDLVTTPVDSEEEAEQIHQILEDLNNIVNSEMNGVHHGVKKEKDIVPVHLKSPPKRSLNGNGPSNGNVKEPRVNPRPWPGSSASDDDDSDILELCKDDKPNVRKVVEQLENMEKIGIGGHPKYFHKNAKIMAGLGSGDNSPLEPKPDYTLPNFHKANHMASKFANFKSPKLYSGSPEASSRNAMPQSGFPEMYEKTSGAASYVHNRFSPTHHEEKKQMSSMGGLRRSESLHASLASIEVRPQGKNKEKLTKEDPAGRPIHLWKSMESLEKDENFTLRWRYPDPHLSKQEKRISLTPSPKSGKSKERGAKSNVSGGELCADYRQNRFTKNSKSNGSSSYLNGSSPINIFSRYTKKTVVSQGNNNNEAFNHKEKENIKLFSLPPVLMSQSLDSSSRISDLPSGLY